MKKITHNKAFVFLTAFIISLLSLGAYAGVAGAIDSSLLGYVVSTGYTPTSAVSSGSLLQPSATTLSAGEVLVGKSIVYNNDPSLLTPDGTVTVTLSAWAQTYTNTAGVVSDPLVPLADGNYVEITDDIGEFAVVGSLPAPLTLSGTTITWDITDQSTLLGSAPITISYTLTVVNPSAPPQPPYTLDYWYSTGSANAVFQPAGDNPYYYTMTETVYNEFEMSMNWNNGTGLNSGAILDNATGVTIVFPKNISAQNLHAYNADGTMNTAGQWNWWPQVAGTKAQAATIVSQSGTIQYFTWQLQWSQMSGQKSYYFTVKDLLGPGLDVQYEAILSGAGGSASMPGGKTTISTTYFQKSYNSNQDDPFYWSGDTINLPLDVEGEIKISNVAPPPTFQLTVDKLYGDTLFHQAWGMTNDTEFSLYIQDETTGLYLVFENMGGGSYAYLGMSVRRLPVLFSVNTPAVLTGIPVEDALGTQKVYSMTEYPSWATSYARPPAVIVDYSVDGGSFESTAAVTPTADANTVLTVRNTLTDQPAAYLRLIKLLDGYPSDRGVSTATEFKVKVWDATNGDYLLFVKPDAASLASGSGWDQSNYANGSYYTVGNDGASTGGAWVFSNSYWEGRYAAGSIEVTDTIPLYSFQVAGVSNVWPGSYEIRELDFNGNLLSASPDNSWWQAYYNFIELTRVEYQGSPTQQGELAPSGTYLVTITNFFQPLDSNNGGGGGGGNKPPAGGGGSGGGGNRGDKPYTPPDTGDSNNLVFWLLLTAVSITVTIGTTYGKSQRQSKVTKE